MTIPDEDVWTAAGGAPVEDSDAEVGVLEEPVPELHAEAATINAKQKTWLRIDHLVIHDRKNEYLVTDGHFER
jgi:hypothetical protein